MQSTEARCVLEEPLDWADGFLVVYNISDRTSFLNAKGVLRQIRETRADNCKGSEVILLGSSVSLLLIAVACRSSMLATAQDLKSVAPAFDMGFLTSLPARLLIQVQVLLSRSLRPDINEKRKKYSLVTFTSHVTSHCLTQ